MFLSNWLVFKIVLAAVTGLVDYPLAADVLLVYDNANKLYLSGGSLEYVSNVVLYKGETSYTLGMGDIINKTTTTAYEVALPASSVHATFGINQDATRYVHQYPEASGYLNGKFQVYSGTPSGGYTEYGSEIQPFSGVGAILCSMSADGKYVLVGNWMNTSGYSDGYKMYKDNGSEYVYHSTYTSIGSSTSQRGYQPAFVPSNNNFVITGTGGGSNESSFYFKLYVYDPLTETWTGKTTVHSLNAPTSDKERGTTGKSFTYDGKYLMMSDNGTPTRGEVYEVDWDANTMVNVWYTTEGSVGDGAGGAISPDNRYVVLCKHTGNPYRVYENMSGDWTTVKNVTSQFDLTGSGTSTSFGSYGVGFSGYSSENTTPLYIGQAAGLYGDGKFRLENWAKRSHYEIYITQPGTYRADLQICGIDYKTNEVEVTGSVTPENGFNETIVQTITSSDGGFGICSIDGDYSVIGAIGYDTNKGAVYVFYRSNGIWAQQARIVSNDYSNSNGFGNSVAISGDRVIVGQPSYSSNNGKIEIFHRSGTSWTHVFSFTGSSASDQLGKLCVDIDGDYAIAGSLGYNTNTGRLYIYHYSNGSWAQQYTLDGESTYDEFGVVASISGDYIIVGARFDDDGGSNAGTAYIYKRTNTTWNLQNKFIGESASDDFGYGVAIYNEYAAIAAPGTTNGRLYIYKRTDTTWNIISKLDGPYTGSMGFDGCISMTDEYIIIGDHYNNITFVYRRFGETWSLTNELTGSGSFGRGVDISSSNDVIIGSYSDKNCKLYSIDPVAGLTFDGYNQLSLTNTPTYTSSKLAYGSNVYDIGTLTSDINIEKTGEYASLTFDTSSNVAYFSNVTVGALSTPTYPFNPLVYSFPITLNGEPAYIISSESKNNYIVELNGGGSLTSTDFDSDGNLISGSVNSNRNPIVPDYANSPFKFNGTQDYSVYLKWKYDFVATHDRYYFYIGETEISTYPRGSLAQTGQREVRWAPSTSNYSNYTEVGSYTDNQFVHLVLTYDASSGTYKLYYKLNDSASIGVSTKTETVVTSNTGKTFEMKIGQDMGGSAGRGTQYTKDIAIFNSVLTQAEAESYINNGISISPTPPSLTFDGYNKLSVQNITPTATTLKYGSNTYDLTTQTDIYIDKAGTYEVSITTSDKFALVSNVVSGTISFPSRTSYRYLALAFPRNTYESYLASMLIEFDDGTKFDNANQPASSAFTENYAPGYGLTVNVFSTSDSTRWSGSSLGWSDGTWYCPFHIDCGSGFTKKVKRVTIINGQSDYQYTLIVPRLYGASSVPSTPGLAANWNYVCHVESIQHNWTSTLSSYDMEPTAYRYIGLAGYRTKFSMFIFEFSIELVDGTVYDGSNIPTVSSNMTIGSGSAANTIDGDFTTRANWNSGSTYTSASQQYVYLKVDLGSAKKVKHVRVWSNYTGTYTDGLNSMNYYGSSTNTSSVDAEGSSDWNRLGPIEMLKSNDATEQTINSSLYDSKLEFDGYNKLSLNKFDPTSTTLRLGSNTYDLTTQTDIYIDKAGTYEAEIKSTNTFALVSNVVGTVTRVDVYDYTQADTTEQKMTADNNAVNYDRFGESVAVSGDYAIAGARSDPGEPGTGNGAAYIFVRNGTSWTRQARLLASDGASSDQFGRSVAIDGDYAVIGASGDDDGGSGSGSAYIFKRNGTSWTQQYKLTAGTDAASGDSFGISVAISGDSVIIGAESKNSNAGAAYVYVRSGTSWSLQQKITPSGATANDYFGGSVSISGNYAIIGARGDNSAYVFERNASTWSLHENLTASDGVAGDNFGFSVMIVGDYAIVGAIYGDSAVTDAGSAYVFKRNGTSWSEESILTASNAVNSDYFGNSVAIYGDYAIVGAPYKNSYIGAVYIFKRSGTSWTQQTEIITSDGGSSDFFGTSVAIHGGYVFAGAFGDDDGGTNAGAAYIYTAENILPKLTHDGYNKLSIENITPTATTLKYGSNIYDIGTATNIYIEDTGTYEIETKDANTFALVSNTVSGTIKTVEPVITGAYSSGHALTYDGKLYAWGENSSGELGVGDTTDKTVPTLCTGVPQGEVVSIWKQSVRGQSRWAKTRDGRIWVTGDHDSYCLPGSSADFTTFTDVSAQFGDYTQTSNNVVWASGSERATQVLMENGDVWSFGHDTSSLGVLGQGASPTSDRTPRKLNVSNITKITYGGDLVLALDSSNNIWMWGRNEVGNSTLGWGPYNVPTNIMSTGTNSLTSLLATDSETVVDIESSYYSMFALTDKGTVYCTGHNAAGQLGQGNTTAKTSSDGWVKIEYFTSNAITINKLYVGGGNPHVFADTSDGWYCWGANSTGELGLGDTANKLSPVKFTGVSNIKKFGVGYLVSYAITEDGKYYAWGRGTNYARGDNTTGDISYPKYIDTLPNILAPSFEFDGYDKVFVNTHLDATYPDSPPDINFSSGDYNGLTYKHHSTSSYIATWDLYNGNSYHTAEPNHRQHSIAIKWDNDKNFINVNYYAIGAGNHPNRIKINDVTQGSSDIDEWFELEDTDVVKLYTWDFTLLGQFTANQGNLWTGTSGLKFFKNAIEYDVGSSQIVTVSDPGTYDAQLSQYNASHLKSTTIPETKTTGLYTWAFHHGNFDNAYGDGDILTARDNGRFYADTPSYTGDIGTITAGSSTTSNTTYTFTPASTLTANVLMVAGGGGGGGRYNCGGGGAGGLVYTAGTTLSGTKTIVVGNGDSGGNGGAQSGYNGKDTTFTGLTTAVGGGYGGTHGTAGGTGGSGGGGGGQTGNGPGGSATSGQGFAGGTGSNSGSTFGGGGGGGGAGDVGSNGSDGVGGNGGIGKFFGTGSSFTDFGDEYGEGGYFAGGAGGGTSGSYDVGIPGRGGGGYGQGNDGYMAKGGSQHALPHTGGGGGGSGTVDRDQHPGYNTNDDGGVKGHGGRGGSGIVLIQTNVALPNGANTAVVQVGNPRRRSLPPAVEYMGSEVNRFYIIDSASMPTYKLPTHWYVDPIGSNSNAVFTTQGSHSLQKRADGGTSNVWYATSGVQMSEYGSYMAQTADAVFMPVEQQSYDLLLSIGSNGDNDISFEMNADGTASLRRSVYTTSQVEIAGGSIVCFEAGKWHHIALTVDSGGNAVGYVNGYPVVSGTYTSVAAVGSRVGNMHFRCGISDVTFRKFLTYEVSTYNFHMSPKQVLQRAAEVGLGPKLEYDGLNAINVVNTEPGSGTEITIYESNVNDASNLYVVSCNTSSYLLSNAGTYYAQIKGTDTFTITRPLTVTDDHFPLYQYPPVVTGTKSSLTVSTTADVWNTWTMSDASTGNGEYKAKTSEATNAPGSTPATIAGLFTNGIKNDTITEGGTTHWNMLQTSSATTCDLTLQLPSAKIIRKYVLYPTDSNAPTSPYEPGSSVDPTLPGNSSEDSLRRPKSWIFKGSNDGTNWTDLDTVTNQPPSIYGDVHSISSPASYKYYMISVTANNGSTERLQLGEWQLWGDA